MKIIRFLIPLLLIITAISPSCKKGDTDNTGPVDSSKLLPSVISYYVGVDSLQYSNYYYYDNQNRLTKQATVEGGVITDSKSYTYDSNSNLTNMMELIPDYAVSYGSSIDTGFRWRNPGPVTYPITIAPVTAYDTVNYAVRYTNSLPDSAVITGDRNKLSIKYTIKNNKVSAIRITYQVFGSSIYGNPINTSIHYVRDTINYTYSGDDITQIGPASDGITYTYNTHKSAFCNINMKWFLPTSTIDNEFYKHDLAKIISPLEVISYLGMGPVPVFIEQDYNSTYNKYDYPVQTNITPVMVQVNNGGILVYSSIKFMKYTYIVAK